MKSRLYISIFVLCAFGIGFSQESMKGHSHEKAEIHGGEVAMTKDHHFEVVFKPDAIAVYLYDGAQKPLSANGVTGEVTLKLKEGEAKTLPLKFASMHHMMSEKGGQMHGEENVEKDHDVMMMSYLTVEVDLSKVEPGSMKAVFSLKGLPGKSETEATFTQTFDGFGSEHSHHDEHGEHSHE